MSLNFNSFVRTHGTGVGVEPKSFWKVGARVSRFAYVTVGRVIDYFLGINGDMWLLLNSVEPGALCVTWHLYDLLMSLVDPRAECELPGGPGTISASADEDSQCAHREGSWENDYLPIFNAGNQTPHFQILKLVKLSTLRPLILDNSWTFRLFQHASSPRHEFKFYPDPEADQRG